MNIEQNAFSKDGYLTHQELLTYLPYGKCPSSANGCGWIAAFNYLKSINQTKPADMIRHQMSHFLLFNGKIGTNVFFLYFYLIWKTKSLLRFRICPTFIASKRPVTSSGILMYFTGKGLHFVTFLPVKRNIVRFLNAPIPDRQCISMKKFLKKHSKFPVVIMIT